MKTLVGILIIFLILTSCSGTKVISDFDKTVDFNQYKSFSFYGWPKDSGARLNRFDKERIENSVKNELEKRGIRYVETNGDLLVTLFVVLEKRSNQTAITDFYGYGYFGWYYGYGPGYPWAPGYAFTRFYDDYYLFGTLVIDVFDNQRRVLVWEGMSSNTIEQIPEKRNKSVPKSVHAIMKDFPKKELR